MPWRHIGVVKEWLHHFWPWKYMVNCQLHEPAALRETTRGTHWTGGQMEPRATLDTVQHRKTSCSCWEWNPSCSSHSLLLYRLSYPGHIKYLLFASAEELLQFIHQHMHRWAKARVAVQDQPATLPTILNLLAMECRTTFLANFALFP
jgi:hypothetical protein